MSSKGSPPTESASEKSIQRLVTRCFRRIFNHAFEVEQIAKGTNTIYEIKTDKGIHLALRTSELPKHWLQTWGDVLFSIEVQRFLFSHKFPVAESLSSDDGLCCDIVPNEQKGNPRVWTVCQWIENADVPKVNRLNIQSAGHQLARMHVLLNQMHTPSTRSFTILSWWLFMAPLVRFKSHPLAASRPNLWMEIADIGFQCYDKMLELEAQFPSGGDMIGIIHGDVHWGNLMDDGKKLWYIDYEFACRGYRTYDIAGMYYAIVSAAKDIQTSFGELWDVFLAAYQIFRPLSQAEMESLPFMVLGGDMSLLGADEPDKHILFVCDRIKEMWLKIKRRKFDK